MAAPQPSIGDWYRQKESGALFEVVAHGVPLGLVVSGANTPDGQLLEATLTSGPVERPDPRETPQHLCLDKAYSDAPSAKVAETHGYVLHVPDKANAKKNASASRGGAKPGAGSSKSRTAG